MGISGEVAVKTRVLLARCYWGQKNIMSKPRREGTCKPLAFTSRDECICIRRKSFTGEATYLHVWSKGAAIRKTNCSEAWIPSCRRQGQYKSTPTVCWMLNLLREPLCEEEAGEERKVRGEATSGGCERNSVDEGEECLVWQKCETWGSKPETDGVGSQPACAPSSLQTKENQHATYWSSKVAAAPRPLNV